MKKKKDLIDNENNDNDDKNKDYITLGGDDINDGNDNSENKEPISIFVPTNTGGENNNNNDNVKVNNLNDNKNNLEDFSIDFAQKKVEKLC